MNQIALRTYNTAEKLEDTNPEDINEEMLISLAKTAGVALRKSNKQAVYSKELEEIATGSLNNEKNWGNELEKRTFNNRTEVTLKYMDVAGTASVTQGVTPKLGN